MLGDRLLTVTLARVWHALGIWEKVKLTGTLLWTGLRCGHSSSGSSSGSSSTQRQQQTSTFRQELGCSHVRVRRPAAPCMRRSSVRRRRPSLMPCWPCVVPC